MTGLWAGVWAAIAPVFRLILKAMLGAFLEKANEPTTVVDAERNPDLAARLRERVRREKSGAGPAG